MLDTEYTSTAASCMICAESHSKGWWWEKGLGGGVAEGDEVWGGEQGTHHGQNLPQNKGPTRQCSMYIFGLFKKNMS